jgi:hypothetical protein
MKKPNYEKAFNELCKWIASEQTTLIPKSTLTNKIHRIKEEHIYPETNPNLFNEERKNYAKQ